MVDRRPYADASALVKLVLREPETDALRQYLMALPDPATSRIAFVEVHRALGRLAEEPEADAMEAVWDRTVFIELDASVADSAARIGPPTLRSLDAVHLASALALANDLESFVTYDARLADAARTAGMAVVAPDHPPTTRRLADGGWGLSRVDQGSRALRLPAEARRGQSDRVRGGHPSRSESG